MIYWRFSSFHWFGSKYNNIVALIIITIYSNILIITLSFYL